MPVITSDIITTLMHKDKMTLGKYLVQVHVKCYHRHHVQ